MSKSNATTLYWFRRDLRLQDNEALYQATQLNLPIQCLFIFDTHILDKLENKKDLRVQFIHQEILKIHSELKKLGGSLKILIGAPEKVLPEYLKKNRHIKNIVAGEDFEPYGVERDKKLQNKCEALGVKFQTYLNHMIFRPTEVLKKDGNPYLVYTPYSKAWKKKLQEEKSRIKSVPSEKRLQNLVTPFNEEPPPLDRIGFQAQEFQFSGPTTTKTLLTNYQAQRDFPGKPGTSQLGMHLRFGTVSPKKMVGVALKYSSIWLSELIWREFFMTLLYHFPKTVDSPFKAKYAKIKWRKSQKDFELWTQGKTGYPIVDAGMRELNATGFMHNRVRMITASFLTKHLLIDWRWGERYFASKLLDFELASNVGNWQWVAGCGADAAPYFRVFNPETQTKKFDPELKYIKKWVPELETHDYPEEMVSHKFARVRVLKEFKRALEA